MVVAVEELVRRANAQVETWKPGEALDAVAKGSATLVDIRDIRELRREGHVAGSVHAPRGMLEFWFDPSCKYHRDVFADESRTYVLYCAGGLRSALAAKTLMDMGFDNIAHVDGGFAALKEAGAAIDIAAERRG